MKKIIVFLLTVTIFLTTSCGSALISITGKDNTNMNNSATFVFPGGGFATYKYIDRNLTLNDFVDIKIGMTYKDITDKLGEPNGIYGAGIQWPFYETVDKTYIVLWVGLEPDSKLGNIRVVDSSGRVFELVQNN